MNQVILGDALQVLQDFEDNSIDFVFTSPSPFGFGGKGIGSEQSRFEYTMSLGALFKQVYRILKPTGSVWLQLQDNHDEDGSMNRTPEAVTNYLVSVLGFKLRSKCYWVRTEKFDYQEDYNRFARDVEHLYFFTKSKDHYFNNPDERVLSSVFAYPYLPHERENTFGSGFPQGMIERCISLTCPKNGVVLDPLADSGTTAVVARRMGRPFIMIDIDDLKVSRMKARLGLK